MAEVSLLSDLCTICHSPPKYRCPRCSARTCSLACSKRHKQWAQCSGLRNPAAYLKRYELATPKNFDQDYNFISSIERRIETAERNVTARGVQLQETRPASKRDGPMKGEVNLRQALEKSGVIIERAPAGMKRSSQNKTSWNKNQRCISWTIEWITNSGTADIGTCVETWTLSQAFAKHIGEPPPAKKRKLSKKKKEHNDAASLPTSEVKGPAPPQLSPTTESPPSDLSQASPPNRNSIAPHTLPIVHSPDLPPAPKIPPQSFYLHIPNPKTPSSKPTLLPLPSSQPLSALLRNRLVREFPTIYVLDHPPEELPPEKYTLQRDIACEVAAELAGLLDGGKEKGEERSEGEVDAEDTKDGHEKEDHREQAAGKDHNGSSSASSSTAFQEDVENKAIDKPLGSLATGNDELSWIMRAVI
ncbi:hypothetical protein MMC17_008087 [Xylographa soralifera]|nr:hypothetical protein [Xylographa soralifera]